MTLSKKQITYRKPKQVSQALNEGLRALAERYIGNIQQATTHCLERVEGLTEARLTRSRGKTPPNYTRDGESFITLVWVILVDGLIPYRSPSTARNWLISILNATDLFEEDVSDQHLPGMITLFTGGIAFSSASAAPTTAQISQILTALFQPSQKLPAGESRPLPVLNRLFVGRIDDMTALRERLGISDKSKRHAFTIVRGWPGVGKTALINNLVHDTEVRKSFANGVLWTSIGPNGNLHEMFQNWAHQLGMFHLTRQPDLNELVHGLRTALLGQDILIVVDDVWTHEQGNYIKRISDFQANTLLLTTRFTDVANHLKDIEHDIYVLGTLSEKYALELLTILAPEPIKIHAQRVSELIKVLEGLPLALRVAGPTLQHYHDMHFDINQLIDEFVNDYNRLLDSMAPSDRFDEITGQTPTISLLFQRSVETLSEEAKYAFMLLGLFKEKPFTFNADALRDVWEIDHPNDLIKILIGRGLMESAPENRYRIHQTLHMYAKKLFDSLEE